MPDERQLTPLPVRRAYDLRALADSSYARCPFCGCKSASMHKADCTIELAAKALESVPSERGNSAEAERAMIAGYRAGMKDGITDYAVWNNGGQYVGVLRKPLKQVLAQVNEIPDNIVLQSALRNING